MNNHKFQSVNTPDAVFLTTKKNPIISILILFELFYNKPLLIASCFTGPQNPMGRDMT